MKPLLEKLTLEPKNSFVLLRDKLPYYPTPWHYHPEYELVLVVKSSGKRIVGDNIENFNDGDLVFMGPNLPHVYDNDPEYYEGREDLEAEAIVIHFKEDFLGKGFFSIPEMHKVSRFFEKSKYGIKITGQTRTNVAQAMEDLFIYEEQTRIIKLLQILEELSLSQEYQLLASPGFVKNYSNSGSERLTNVYEYIMKNFASDIQLDEIAEKANMSPNAFCRFFKARTRKTFSTFLNEIRVGNACKLLIEDKLHISQICYESGFNNLSNFNRQFKKITGKSPLAYKKQHQVLGK
ncbi:AraC family transcriptional regulator [Flexithrix dorotheae]|uniref:AraC family transcriptional regulator n=1 Tax=Flexithrix dorotheae TaxID=70993 RepID=UPI00036CD8AB|nr:AraC family transcriptional regulator [Flexithrix dorotheae]